MRWLNIVQAALPHQAIPKGWHMRELVAIRGKGGKVGVTGRGAHLPF